ncbi:unnamed protein product [Thlaspi arvense]|uniref:Retrovirus-related Pol polyprotein from transposon TNT 1-94-like beta-barrel domain-containing protein n=1 Tax=Thlaspi arvense TaxID=13288 RepID=A0AAU9S182_THLAR|nr:unnamed protein product [Thlaspi arvense]
MIKGNKQAMLARFDKEFEELEGLRFCITSNHYSVRARKLQIYSISSREYIQKQKVLRNPDGHELTAMASANVSDDLDYEIWAPAAKATLMEKGLWDVVENGVPPDPSKIPELAATIQAEELSKWRDLVVKDIKALQVLQSSLRDSAFRKTLSASSAKEVWDLLEKGTKQSKLRRLENMHEGETLGLYIARVTRIVEQLRRLDIAKSEYEVTKKVLSSVSRPYNIVAPILDEHMDPKKRGHHARDCKRKNQKQVATEAEIDGEEDTQVDYLMLAEERLNRNVLSLDQMIARGYSAVTRPDTCIFRDRTGAVFGDTVLDERGPALRLQVIEEILTVTAMAAANIQDAVSDDLNYEMWAPTMKATLVQKKLWDVVENGVSPDPRKIPEIKVEELAQWRNREDCLGCFGQGSLDSLERGNEEAKLRRLEKQFEEISMGEKESIDSYFDRKSDYEVIEKALASVSGSYRDAAPLLGELWDLKKMTLKSLVEIFHTYDSISEEDVHRMLKLNRLKYESRNKNNNHSIPKAGGWSEEGRHYGRQCYRRKQQPEKKEAQNQKDKEEEGEEIFVDYILMAKKRSAMRVYSLSPREYTENKKFKEITLTVTGFAAMATVNVSDDLNYEIWAPAFWGVVENGVPSDPSKTPEFAATIESEELSKYRDLVRKDTEALHILQSSLPDSASRKIHSAASAKDVWDLLQKGKEESNLRRLEKKFEEISMDKGETLDFFLDRVLGIVQELRRMKTPQSDYDVISKVLSSLSKPYGDFAPLFEELKFTDLKNMPLTGLVEFCYMYESITSEATSLRLKNLRLESESDKWCSDLWMVSGYATIHMTPYEKVFATLDRTHKGKVGLVDGKVIVVEGKGDVRIVMKEGKKKTIDNVLFVPGMIRNVLSLSQMEAQGCSFSEGGGGECIISDRNGAVLGETMWDKKDLALRLQISCGLLSF